MDQCRRYRITGKVQGVSFRAATRHEARRLGLTGWVRNMPNGDVEVLACGDTPALDALARWLGRGPPLAQVSSVQQHAAASESTTSFELRYD